MKGFTAFPLAVDSINDAIEKDEENMMAFVEMSKKFRELSILSGKDKENKKQTSPEKQVFDNDLDDLRDASRDYSAGNIPIDPGKKIVGYVGSTGKSSGPHIHIETGNGYGDTAGGNIPAEVLNNIIVDGKPLSQHSLGDGLGANRNHKGFDYPIRKGAPIQLQGGLKFVDFDEVSDPGGYGKSIVITDKNGNPYLIGHLSAGPEDPKEFEKRREKARKKQQPKPEKEEKKKNGEKTPIQLRLPNSPVPPPISVEEFRKLYGSNEGTKTGIKKYNGEEYYKQNGKYKNKLRDGTIEEIDKRIYDMVSSLSSSISPKVKNNQLIASASGAPQSLFVYAIQPQETFVPFPYPMPIPQESEAPSPETPRLPSTWGVA